MGEFSADRPGVIVVGAGVSGLTTALELCALGARVRVIAAERSAATVSSVAGAIWYPYLAHPEAKVARWGLETFERLVTMSREHPEGGVILREGVDLRERIEDAPAWLRELPGARIAARDELPAGCGAGIFATVPVIEMGGYLAHLESRLAERGVEIETRRCATLDEAGALAPVVVDCAGLGAATLAPDPGMTPIRGQILRIAQPREPIERFTLDHRASRSTSYVIPRRTDVILGGTAQSGDASTEVRREDTAAILEACEELEPRVRGAEVLEVRVGLRPGRREIRVERERRGWGVVVHNYGHGGAGVTVSWGCAREAAGLAVDALANA